MSQVDFVEVGVQRDELVLGPLDSLGLSSSPVSSRREAKEPLVVSAELDPVNALVARPLAECFTL